MRGPALAVGVPKALSPMLSLASLRTRPECIDLARPEIALISRTCSSKLLVRNDLLRHLRFTTRLQGPIRPSVG